jgi:hypothetical protein
MIVDSPNVIIRDFHMDKLTKNTPINNIAKVYE